MKLAIIIVLLAFCFCESYANISRCRCSLPGEIDRQYAGLVEYFRPSLLSANGYEGRDGFQDLHVSVSKKDNIETRTPVFRVGMGNLPLPTLRNRPDGSRITDQDLDVPVSKKDNIELETRKAAFRVGMGNTAKSRTRRLWNQPYLRSSRESFGEPEYATDDSTYGDYETQG